MMKRNHAHFVALTMMPLLAGTLTWLLDIIVPSLAPNLGRAAIVVARLCVALIVMYAAETIAFRAAQNVMGCWQKDCKRQLTLLRSPFKNGGSSELDRALYRVSAYPVGIACLMGFVVSPSMGPDGLSNLFFFEAAIFVVGIIAAYAIMASGWEQCKELARK